MRTDSRKLILPTSEESRLALEALKALDSNCFPSERVKIQFKVRGSSRSVEVPRSAAKLLFEILRQTASGNAVRLVPVRKELTTQEAAEILNVSRPFVIGLLEKREIPFRMVGAHRRIPLSALLDYKRKTDAIRDEALDLMAAEAQELKLY